MCDGTRHRQPRELVDAVIVQRASSLWIVEGEASVAALHRAYSSRPIGPQRATVDQVRTGHQPGAVTELCVRRHSSCLSLEKSASVASTLEHERLWVPLVSSRGVRERGEGSSLEWRRREMGREAPNAVLQPDRRHQHMTPCSDRMTVDCPSGRIGVHCAALLRHRFAPSLPTA